MDISFENPKLFDITCFPNLITFGFYSPREIRELSSVEIFCPVFFDNKGNSIQGGLYDSRMGPGSKTQICPTCKKGYSGCPGHFGFIDFALPLPNPFLKNLFFLVLKSKCWYCGFFNLSNWRLKIFLMTSFVLDNPGWESKLKKKNRKLNSLFFPEKKSLKISQKSLQNLIAFEKLINESFKKKVIRESKVFVSSEKKNKGENWSNNLSDFFEKCKEEHRCHKCKRERLEILNSENFLNFSDKKEIIVKGVKFFPNKGFSSMQKRKFSLLSKNICFLFSKNQKISFKPFQLKEEMDFLWKYESEFFQIVWGFKEKPGNRGFDNGSHSFFLNNLLVPPNKFRPVNLSKIKNEKGQIFSNPQNFYFIRMLKLNQQLLLSIGVEKKIFSENWGIKSYSELEKNVSNFYDNFSFSSTKNKQKPIGVRQQLEKKMGLFRMHFMGKRVFHSARSIIIPDPFLEGNEVGVPLSFSSNLTLPDPVNYLNLRKENFLQKKNNLNFSSSSKNFFHSFQTLLGKKIYRLSKTDQIEKAQFIGICFTLFQGYKSGSLPFFGANKFLRFLKKGDIVLLNRQPSLHKVSIMSHKVRIFSGSKCIRLHYSNCNAYNADFDGDEMNLHFPQNLIAKSEGVLLSLASNQGKVPTDNSPIRGLIQDHIISSVFLTKKDTFLDEKNFSQLLSCSKESETFCFYFPIPSILKPKILWTGKQLISKLLGIISKNSKDFFFESRTKITSLSIGEDETRILIRKGELLRGVFDGSQMGKNKYGVTNGLMEVFGNFFANKFLHNLSCLLTFFQRIHGHTTKLDDLILIKEVDKQRIRVFREERKLSRFYLRKTLSRKGIYLEENFRKSNWFLSCARFVAFLCSQRILLSQFIISMKDLLSRIFSKSVENCIPGSLEKGFFSNGFSKMTISGAKGSLVNTLQVCLSLGQTELEGRCIPRGITGKTLPIFPPFDFSSGSNGYISQRFSTGINQSDFFFHCMAGREGLLDTAVKTSQSGYIQRSIIKHLESHSINYDFSVRFGKGNLTQLIHSNNGLFNQPKDLPSLGRWFIQNTTYFPNLTFSLQKAIKKIGKGSKSFIKNQDFWYFVHRFKGIKEFQDIVKEFFFLKKFSSSKEGFKVIKKFFFWILSKNFLDPGEPVGLITGQSLGEPCTQMTLNTFHFAGKFVSNGNVGISRLKEILLTGSKRLKDPTMSVTLKKNLPEETFFFIEKRFRTIFLNDLLETASLHIERSRGSNFILYRFKISPKNLFKHQLALEENEIKEKFVQFWEKSKISYEKFKKTQSPLKKVVKSKIVSRFKSLSDEMNLVSKEIERRVSFSYPDQLNFKTKLFKPVKEPKKGTLKYLTEKLVKSNFCIRDIPRISNCFVDLENKSIHIQGINFFALWYFQDTIEVNKIFTNDIFSSLITYGIECARNFIFNELQTVFNFQSISVSKRHLDLASDYMTRLGNYRAFNRQGLKEENGFQKITYETATRFIIEHAIYKKSDNLSSISSSVALGKICKIGTGSFDLLFS